MSTRSPRDDPLQSLRDAVGTSTLALAVVGAVAALLTTFVPGSPILGGALSGWLHREDPRQGATIGGVSGLLFAFPAVAFGTLFVGVFLGASLFGAVPGAFGVLVLLAFAVGVAYTVGLGAVGGYLGVVAYQRVYGPDERPAGGVTGGARSRDGQFDDTQF
jgi:hypothetical protein